MSNDRAATTARRTTAPDGTIGTTGPEGLVIPVIPPGKTLPPFLVPAIAMKIDEPATSSTTVATLADLTLADLVTQLGPPPQDVAERWCRAAQDMLDHITSSSLDQGLPSSELCDLRWGVSGTIEPISLKRLSCTSHEWMARFQEQLLCEENELPIDVDLTNEIHSQNEAATSFGLNDSVNTASDPSPPAKLVSQEQGKRVSLAIAGAVIAIGFVATGLLWLSQRSQPKTASSSAKIDRSTDAIGSPKQTQSKPSSQSDQWDAEASPQQKLIEFEDTSADTSSVPQQIDISLGSQATTSLAPLSLPKAKTTQTHPSDNINEMDSELQNSETSESADLTNPLLRPIDDPSPESSQEPDAEIALNSGLLNSDQSKPIDELFEADNNDSIPADEQPTSAEPAIVEGSWKSAVSLIDKESLANGVTLTDVTVQSVSLESVAKESGISISGNSPTWQITAEGASIAVITSGNEGLLFQWSPESHRTPAARDLQQSRLQIDGRSVYLRLPITADPLRLRFDNVDQKPAWDLMMPVVTNQTKLESRLDLPESIEVAWIEPMAADTFRNGRAIAILTSTDDDESYALGVRADFSCGRKLTCRLRYAARLDPNMPWQPISRDRLNQYAAELTASAAMISREAERLARMDEIAYDLAGRRGKQIITQKTIRNDALSEQVQTAIKRISQLQGLMAKLENEAALHLSLTTQWPNEQQSILRVGDTAKKP